MAEETQTTPGPVSLEDIAAAEKLIDLQFTEAERAMMLKNANQNLETYARFGYRVIPDAIDGFAVFFKVVAIVAAALVILASIDYFRAPGETGGGAATPFEAEVYVLLVFATLGFVLMAGSADLIVLALAVSVSAAPSGRAPYFFDVAVSSGIDFVNVYGGLDRKRYILETTGSGAAFFAESLIPDDRFRTLVDAAVREGRLALDPATASDDRLNALCDYRAALHILSAGSTSGITARSASAT